MDQWHSQPWSNAIGYTFYNRPCLATGMLVHTCFYIWLLFTEKCKVWLTIAKQHTVYIMRCRTNINQLMYFNCYTIKVLLIVGSNRRSHGYTYFLGIESFLFSLLPATFSQQTMVLAWSTNPGLWKFKCTLTWVENRYIMTQFDVPSTPTVSSFSFVVDIWQLFCN